MTTVIINFVLVTHLSAVLQKLMYKGSLRSWASEMLGGMQWKCKLEFGWIDLAGKTSGILDQNVHLAKTLSDNLIYNIIPEQIRWEIFIVSPTSKQYILKKTETMSIIWIDIEM